MKRLVHKRQSIYMQMSLLLIVAAIAACFLFLSADCLSEGLVEQYMERTDYAGNQKHKAVINLQEYITSGQLHSRDAAALERWVKKQRLLNLTVYKNGIQVFDSRYPDLAIWEEEIGVSDYDWIKYDTVQFADGPAEIQLTGAYSYQVYSTVRIIEMSVSFIVFLLIVLFGIRKKMMYILLLSNEVEVLEGGFLHRPITVLGRDELSVLAEGLESMRLSFLESQKKEALMFQQHQRVITEMSHDLRTPVTSIILYAEILKAGKCNEQQQKQVYPEKILQKALQIKERSDRLLGYSLNADNKKGQVLENSTFSEVFFDLLSEACGYLDQSGFQTDLRIDWPDLKIAYAADSVTRIIDNITSNIVKYANPKYPVVIALTTEGSSISLLFENRVARLKTPPEGFNIGVQSIRSLMEEMGGSCRSEQNGDTYSIELSFRVI